MTITTKVLPQEDSSEPSSTHHEIELYSNGKCLATLTVHNQEGRNSFVDYRDELNGIEYNLLEVEKNGAIINDEPIINV